MNNRTASPVLTGDNLKAFEQIESRLRHWCIAAQAEEHAFPVLIDATTLDRAEYPAAFPHLLMASAIADVPSEPFAEPNLRLAGWYLSPAVCYHAYAALAGQILEPGRILTARNCCFRNEETVAPGRRQIEFQMRELILVGKSDWIEARIESLQPGIAAMANELGLPHVEWQPASDPFFLPTASGKAQMQRLLGAKIELCLPDGLAIASINRHRQFFGDRFNIRTAAGLHAHSACIAFGLDRWATASSATIRQTQ